MSEKSSTPQKITLDKKSTVFYIQINNSGCQLLAGYSRIKTFLPQPTEFTERTSQSHRNSLAHLDPGCFVFVDVSFCVEGGKPYSRIITKNLELCAGDFDTLAFKKVALFVLVEGVDDSVNYRT